MKCRTRIVLALVLWLLTAVSSIQAQDEFPKGAYAEPIRKFSTIVVDSTDQPVPDATIKLFAGGRVTNHRAGTDGRLDVLVPESMVANAYLFASDATGLQMIRVSIGLVAREGVEGEIRIGLKPAVPVHVLVTDGNEVPLANVLVAETLFVTGHTDSEGRAVLLAPRNYNSHVLFAFDSKQGLDYVWLSEDQLISRGADGAAVPEPVHLRLEGFQEPVTISVVDQDGVPVEGALVLPGFFKNPKNSGTFSPPSSLDEAEFGSVTDQQGIAILKTIPVWDESRLAFHIRKSGYSEDVVSFDADRDSRKLKSTIIQRVLVKGRVEFPAGISSTRMQLRFRGFKPIGNLAMFREEKIVHTDEQGKFEFEGIAKDLYLPHISNSKVAFAENTIFIAGEAVDGEELRFALREPTLIKGKVTSGEDRVPAPDQVIRITNYVSDDLFLAKAIVGRPSVPSSTMTVGTNSNGEFEASVGFGKYHIAGPVHFAPVDIVVGDQREISVELHHELPSVGSLRGKVIDGVELKPVVGAIVLLMNGGKADRTQDSRTVTDDEGKFALERMFVPVTIYVVSNDRTMAAFVEVEAEQQVTKVKLISFQTVTGRLIDGETGKPMVNADVNIVHRVAIEGGFVLTDGNLVRTDEAGRFVADAVLPDLNYHLGLSRVVDGRAMSTSNVSEFKVDPSTKPFDLGDVIYNQPVEQKRNGK